MKRLAILAVVSALAVAAGAAPAPPSLPQQAACPTPAPQPDANTLKWKGGKAEFDDFMAVQKAASSPQDQLPLVEAFVKKYPTSDYINDALLYEAGALAQTGQFAPAVAAAEQLTQSPGATAAQLVNADFIIAVSDPNILQAGDSDLADKIAALKKAVACGEPLTAPLPPANQAQYTTTFTKAAGFAAYMAKDYSGAISTLTQAIQQNPNDYLPYYWLGVAEVTQEQPDFNTGLYDLAKAVVLQPAAASVKSYLATVYGNYHGSADGLQDIMTAAQNNSGPIPVKSSVDLQNEKNQADYVLAVEALKHQLPPADSFPGIKARLLKPEMEADVWKTVKGEGLELDGIVKAIGLGGKSIDIAVGATDTATPADLRLTLVTPLPATKRPKVGEKVTVDGVADSYKKTGDSVMITFVTGWVKGYQDAPKI